MKVRCVCVGKQTRSILQYLEVKDVSVSSCLFDFLKKKTTHTQNTKKKPSEFVVVCSYDRYHADGLFVTGMVKLCTSQEI